MALMAGGPTVENKGASNMCKPSGFPEDATPPPQCVADVERLPYKAAWHEAVKIELDRHKTTGTHNKS